MSIVNMLPWREKKINLSLQVGVLKWRRLGVCCRILILSLAFALLGPSVLCRGAVCLLLSPTTAAVLVDGMWAALLKASPGWVPGKRAICGPQEQVRRQWLRRSSCCGIHQLLTLCFNFWSNWGQSLEKQNSPPPFTTSFWSRGISSCQAHWKVWTGSLAVVWLLTEDFTCFPEIIIVRSWWIQAVGTTAARCVLARAFQQSRYAVRESVLGMNNVLQAGVKHGWWPCLQWQAPMRSSLALFLFKRSLWRHCFSAVHV